MEHVEIKDAAKDAAKDAVKDVAKDAVKDVAKDAVCTHENINDINGYNTCADCGWTINEKNIYNNDFSTINHCRKKTDPRSIYKTVEGKNISQKIINDADKIYKKMTYNVTEQKYEIFRGNNRKSLVIIALYNAYIQHGIYKTTEELCRQFGINGSHLALSSLKYKEAFPNIENIYIKPVDILKTFLFKLGIDIKYYPKIIKLCNFLSSGKYELFNRSTPKSVAAAVIYTFLCIYDDYKLSMGINKTIFAQKIGLSDITITKLVKEALRILKKPNVKI